MDNDRTPIQSWKKNSGRNGPFRLSKVQEALPRSTKQEDNLGTPNTAQKRQKKSQVKPMWLEKAYGIKFTPPLIPLKQISSLEKNGEFKVTLKTGALMLLTIIIIIPIAIYLIFSYGPIVGIPMLSFLYPSIPAIYAARIILYLNWERKNQKLILSDLTRVYVAPRNFEKSSSG